ncbi:MAG TPA: UDP-N-acetylmuramoyl-L-alanyl-D-glutamate--2,6-diaminopimelate ligase [Saprospiraceae bacterium]|nr:UDP-N-acetylmuramoyl-L-alanyl-D-glutamate--2,6-diaminopimelate ligase [Saprospiraceae bacterium]
MELNKLLNLAGLKMSDNRGNAEISGIAIDSRAAIQGSLFVAIQGNEVDGHRFIQSAIDKGAVAVVCENEVEINGDVELIIVPDSHEAAGKLASAFYGFPSEKLQLVGVTGTNGKTTTVTLLYQLMMEMGKKSGLISTVENRIGDKVLASTHTTPDPISLNALLKDMVDSGCQYAFMEVSSHAAHQKRISGLKFAGAVFTNISHDHLDYHKTFDEYIAAKKSFFDGLAKGSFALSNLDDKRGEVMLQNTPADKYYYSLRRSADFKGKIFENTLEGLAMELDGVHVHLRLIGEFNAYNALCVYAVGRLLGYDKEDVLTQLSAVPGAIGRFETIRDVERDVLFIVDYAHTPDALEKVLNTIHDMKKDAGVITVVGCGGHRDKEKRPVMGALAAKLSREAIFTDDNPRDESPEDITGAMVAGLTIDDKAKVLIINDRVQAIRTAAKLAQRGDIILVAGKGHETYQLVKDKVLEMDDRKIIKDIIGK